VSSAFAPLAGSLELKFAILYSITCHSTLIQANFIYGIIRSLEVLGHARKRGVGGINNM
jgi:hypothetical protein